MNLFYVLIGLEISLFSIAPPLQAASVAQIETKKLIVHDSSYRAVTHKTEAEGVEDIRKLLLYSETEEAWAFIPSINNWYQLSKNRSATHATKNDIEVLDSSVAIDTEFLDHLEKEYDQVVIYHFHPANGVHVKNRNPGDQRLLEAIFSVDAAQPSFEDFALMIDDAVYVHQFWMMHWYPQTTWKICSELGVTEFSLTPEGIERFAKMNSADKWKAVIANYSSGQARYLKDRKVRIDVGNSAYVPAVEARLFDFSLSSADLNVLFTPYPDKAHETLER